MKLVKSIILTIIGVIAFLVVYSILAYNNYNKQGYDEYKDNRDLFENVKDDILNLSSEYNPSWYVIEWDGKIIIDDKISIYVDENLKYKINRIYELSPKYFDFIRYAFLDGEHFVSFNYDWEGVRGKTHYIVHCKSYETVVEYYTEYYDESPLDFKIKKLGNDWYGVAIR